MANRTQESTEQLKEDLQHLSQTIEELVSATADDSRSNIRSCVHEPRSVSRKPASVSSLAASASTGKPVRLSTTRWMPAIATSATTPGPASASAPV